ncbi:DUF4198 domain-containing protein [Microbulbifer thermotolerans]|uniref:ABC transporter permease n=1 Tax=Microbulbifer thermotolerans TaxID=252514 RepID=A0A143HK46_MICTH|nr:DUF4198 domain-containing protein [Microbulbifer thermotolerans]AMX02105.1 ABC transporter permease [Microbulbifer thermotolerans]MCX2781429.1 DUF4198 domain-containing protein [Microbulbifer thermotolerans]MCX2802385.1 DUF4198 domain-containing protein [Microbulbifer thermotolerans]MCX2830136.1 DUF4198 domain-containing protein [Microbulbifer thermotolerans]MCX2841262.1 DUF4198 domain-containing protein [Microbulbifer thermotolerans]
MKRNVLGRALLAAVISAGVAMQAQAHRMWILPSATVLSGESPYVTFDAAVSNTIFFPDHVALPMEQVAVTAPSGEQVPLQNLAKGHYRSTFDLQLKEEGTYKVSRASAGLRAFWKDAEGKRQMWPGRGKSADDAEFATAVPKDAKDLRVIYDYRRTETFVTAGNPTSEVLAPTGVGLELVPVTHPNDLYVGEIAEFKLLIDGEPAKNAEVVLIPGGTRYRDSQNEITAKAGSDGLFSVTWPAAGRYFMEAEYEDDKAKAPATKRHGVYSATFEVLPL